MRKIRIISLNILLITLLFCLSCEGPTGPKGVDGDYDKQIRLIIFDSGMDRLGTSDTSGTMIGELIKFNKNYFTGVDSITFVARVYNEPTNTTNNTATVQLYNSTDNVPIENTLLSTNSTSPVNLETGNVYNDLPEKEITLQILLKSKVMGQIAILTGKSYLFLYRE